jgi:hypothetical protein
LSSANLTRALGTPPYLVWCTCRKERDTSLGCTAPLISRVPYYSTRSVGHHSFFCPYTLRFVLIHCASSLYIPSVLTHSIKARKKRYV